MAKLRELNIQSNPFWEWVADIERQSRTASGHGGQPSSSIPPPRATNEKAQEGDDEEHNEQVLNEKMPPTTSDFEQPPPEFEDPPSPPPPNHEHFGAPHHYDNHHGPDRRHSRGRGGERGRGSHGYRGGPRGHYGGPPGHGFGGWGNPMFGAHRFGGPFGGRRGGCRGARGDNPFQMFGSGGFDMAKLGQMLKDNLGFDPIGHASKQQEDDKDFTPPIDVFDTPQAYFIHISLAGAKKQDISVSWDAENFQIIVSGIIHRSGDEEFLKTLAVDERDIGLFERKIKLGTRADPVHVDGDTISAKMEDGVLMIKAPKHEEFIEIKKVDIE